VWDQERWSNRLLGSRHGPGPIRSTPVPPVPAGARRLHAGQRRRVSHLWDQEQRRGRVLGQRRFRVGNATARAQSRHPQRGRWGPQPHLCDQERRYHHLLGTRRLRPGALGVADRHLHTGQRRRQSQLCDQEHRRPRMLGRGHDGHRHRL